MNKTKIEWVKNPDGSQGYTWNPITGCLNHENGLCKGGGFPCYAYKLANGRLKQRYLANKNWDTKTPEGYDGYPNLDPFYPRFWEEKLYHPWSGKPKGIFVCDMSDLFGVGIPEEWTKTVLDLIRLHTENRFYLLTKQPQNLIKFSPFPENCWVGVTATGLRMFNKAMLDLQGIKAKVKYISLEPLLEQTNMHSSWLTLFGKPIIDWLIIGACTGTKEEMTNLARNNKPFLTEMPYGTKWTTQPNPEWVREIVEAADKAGIPVFLKDNLRPLLIPEDCSKPNYLTEDIFWASEKAQLRQETPKINEER